jgi:hypothetical protein
MKNWNREQIVELILKIEENKELINSRIDGVLIWPWIRVKLFFIFLEKFEGRALSNKPISDKHQSSKIGSALTYLKEILKLVLLRRSNFLFVGANSHREVFNTFSYNKFFDLFRSKNLNSNGVLIEYSESTKDAYLEGKNLSFDILKRYSKYFFRVEKSEKYFWDELKSVLEDNVEHFSEDERIYFINRLKNHWLVINSEKKVWIKILKFLKPEKIFTLCYYSSSVYSLNLAAHELEIPTIELQHGPINNFHLAYGSFSRISHLHSSFLLPDQFLVWDKFSLDVLSNSFPEKEINIIGLPWFNFLDHSGSKNNNEKKEILYALQPRSEIGDLFPEFLINWIKQSKDDCIWLIRMHPRQASERDDIVKRLSAESIYDLVDIDFASSAPLPSLLSSCDLVFTNFSGVVIEAAVMGVPSVALHPNALIYFSSQQESKNMFYFDRNLDVSWRELLSMLDEYFDEISEIKYNSFEIFDKLYINESK